MQCMPAFDMLLLVYSPHLSHRSPSSSPIIVALHCFSAACSSKAAPVQPAATKQHQCSLQQPRGISAVLAATKQHQCSLQQPRGISAVPAAVKMQCLADMVHRMLCFFLTQRAFLCQLLQGPAVQLQERQAPGQVRRPAPPHCEAADSAERAADAGAVPGCLHQCCKAELAGL